MQFTRFNRYANMSTETTTEIMQVLREVCLIDEPDMALENELYGLFDGYLYTSIAARVVALPSPLAGRILRLLDVIKHYPVIGSC